MKGYMAGLLKNKNERGGSKINFKIAALRLIAPRTFSLIQEVERFFSVPN